jgi:hypothetical protein
MNFKFHGKRMSNTKRLKAEGEPDANLVITWSHNPYAKSSIPGKPGKSGLIAM